MKKQKGFTLIELFYTAIIPVAILGVWGWVWNIIKIIDSDFAVITGMLVARIIGVFIAPLGAVLGFF